MGNCVMKESSTQWGGDDWGSPLPVPSEAKKLSIKPVKKMEEKSFLEEKKTANCIPSSTTKGTEVKIKITKKQLEELLGKVDAKGQPVKDVLTKLLNLSDGFEANPRSWRPALQSIPEAEVY